MFTVLIKYADGLERLLSSNGEISFSDGILSVGGEEVEMEPGDVAFVMNRDGNTVRKYRG